MKESLKSQDKRVIFRETFQDEVSVRRNGGTPTDVEFNNGIATFNGTSSKIKYPASQIPLILKYGSSFSIRFRIKNVENNANFLTFERNSNDFVVLHTSTNFINISTYNGVSYHKRKGSTDISGDVWKEGVVTYNGTTFNIYVDGTIESMSAGGVAAFSEEGLNIANVSIYYYECNYDLLEIYDVELTADEVSNLKNNRAYKEPVFDNEILSIDTRMGSIIDRWGNAIINTDVKIIRDGNIWIAQYNNSLSILNLGKSSSLNNLFNNDVSFLFWIKALNSDHNSIINCLSSDYSKGFEFRYQTFSDLVDIRIVFSGGYLDKSWNIGNYFGIREYTLLSFVYSNSTKKVRLYINLNDLGESVAGNGNYNDDSDNNKIIGRFFYNADLWNFGGNIPIVKITKGILTTKQISQYYTATKGGFLQ